MQHSQTTLSHALQMAGEGLFESNITHIFLSQDFFNYTIPFGCKLELGEGWAVDVCIHINDKPVFVMNSEQQETIAFHMKDKSFLVTDFIEDLNYKLNFEDFKSLML